MRNILFITWDGPQTSYMEGLFMPIFHELSKKEEVNFHVIQFTWADHKKTEAVKKVAAELGIRYNAVSINKKPIASLGSLATLLTASRKIKRYIKLHRIDTVMPRSTFPALMVNKIKNKNFKVIFDADGLPLEERVDFGGLKNESRQYRWMKAVETQMLKSADHVITRSQKAIDIHLKTIGEDSGSKFSVVQNGRSTELFHYNTATRSLKRTELGITDELLFVYAGSLGPQYCLPEMLEIFGNYAELHPAHFLVLTGNTEFAADHIRKELLSKITVKKVPVSAVPDYLNAADVAFALREPSFSMQGVAPIKLGEYLLCGLPVLASKGIGDTDVILEKFRDCLVYEHARGLQEQMSDILTFTENAIFADRSEIGNCARAYFSLEAAALSYRSALTIL